MSRARPAPAAAAPVPADGPPPAVRLLVMAALVALTVLAFHGVVRNDWFAIDDHAHVTDNPHVRTGITAANVAWELTHADVGNWQPLTMLSHMLDVQFFGLNPGAHHAVNLAWHVLNVLLVLLVLCRATGSFGRSAVVAALFAVHPLRVESVAWIAERKDVLSTSFFLLALLAWIEWTRRGGAARYAAVVAALVLGLAAKPMLVTTPFVLLLLDAWPLGRLEFAPGARERGRDLAARLAEKWPLWLVAAGFALLTLRTQAAAGALAITPGLTWPMRASNAMLAYGIYVRDVLWPRHLVPFVPHTLRVELVPALLGLAALALVTVLVLRARTRPWLAFGWLWWVGMLVPVINLVQVGPHARADRFTYVPGIGLAVLLVWEIGERIERVRAARIAAFTALLAVLVALVVATQRQVARWRDTRTLYEWTVSVMPGNTVIRWWLGDQYLVAGEPAKALREYEQVLREAPGRVSLHTDIATALAASGRFDEAREHLVIVTREAPAADAWHDLARFDVQRDRLADAAAELDSALAWTPDDASLRAELALVRLRSGDGAAAAASAAEAARLAPGNAEYARLLAETLRFAGRWADAAEAYAAVLRAAPSDANALMNLAWLRATAPDAATRDGAAALALADRAAAAAGRPIAAIEATRAAALAESGRFADAVAAAGRAVALAREAGSSGEASEYAGELARYRAGRPNRDVAHAGATAKGTRR